jgi:cytochrome c
LKTLAGRFLRSAAWALLLGKAVVLGACLGQRETPPVRQVPGGDAARGRRALAVYGCGGCHVVPGVPEALGRVAPPLTFFGERGFVAGVLSNNPDNLIRWIQAPREVNPRTAMPNLGVAEADARDIAAYLYSLRR